MIYVDEIQQEQWCAWWTLVLFVGSLFRIVWILVKTKAWIKTISVCRGRNSSRIWASLRLVVSSCWKNQVSKSEDVRKPWHGTSHVWWIATNQSFQRKSCNTSQRLDACHMMDSKIMIPMTLNYPSNYWKVGLKHLTYLHCLRIVYIYISIYIYILVKIVFHFK